MRCDQQWLSRRGQTKQKVHDMNILGTNSAPLIARDPDLRNEQGLSPRTDDDSLRLGVILGISFFIAVTSVLVSIPTEADPHPVFAQQHNMRCSGCHTVPITNGNLNSDGQAFRDNGYNFPGT